MPSDLVVPSPLRESAVGTTTEVVISENGTPSQSFGLLPVIENTHIGTSCDTTLQKLTQTCNPLITHAGGTLVLPTAPAHIGEVLTMWAFGMGSTSPRVPEGQPTPTPAPVVVLPFSVEFEYANPVGLQPSSANPISTTASAPSLVFAGLTPGEVGVYQANFVVKPPTFGAPSCPQAMTPANAAVEIFQGKNQIPSDTARMCIDTAGPVQGDMTVSNPGSSGSFSANTIWYPVGSNLTGLGQPVPPQSVGAPGPKIVSGRPQRP